MIKEIHLTLEMPLEEKRRLVNEALDTDGQIFMVEEMDEEGIRTVYNNYLTLLNEMALMNALYSLKSLKLEDNKLKVVVLITDNSHF